MKFGLHTVRYLPKLMTRGEGKPKVPADISGPVVFANMQWFDWPEARLQEVGMYLRGNKSLALGTAWRAVFPTHW